MRRHFLSTSLATLVIGAAVLAGASIMPVGSAQAYEGRYERGYDRPAYGFRPAPPAYHGYWGHRRWQRYHDGRDFRGPPPAWRYGWR